MSSPQEASYLSGEATSGLQPPIPPVFSTKQSGPELGEPSALGSGDLKPTATASSSSPAMGKLRAVFCNDRQHNSGYGRLPISHSHSHEPRVPGHEESLVPGLHKQWSR